MIFPKTLSEIQSLIGDEIQESLHLDYKEARAVGKTDKQKFDFAKDVSAFANSDGGVLVYGIKEKGHLPVAIPGIEHSKFKREFFEQTIRTNISQPSPNFTVVQIPINEQESVYSIKVEKRKELTNEVKRINESLSKIARISNSTGLGLSVSTLKNLRNLVEEKPFEKIDPTNLNCLTLKEILEIDFDLASNLEDFFWRGNKARGLKDVEGVNDDIIKKLKNTLF